MLVFLLHSLVNAAVLQSASLFVSQDKLIASSLISSFIPIRSFNVLKHNSDRHSRAVNVQ